MKIKPLTFLLVFTTLFMLLGCERKLNPKFAKEQSRLKSEFPIIQTHTPTYLFLEHVTYDGWCDEEYSEKRWSFGNKVQWVGHFFSLTKDDIKKYSEFVGNSLTVYWENTHDQYDRNVPPWACEIGSKPQDVGTEKIFNAECTRFISGDEFNSGEHVRITKESKASCTLKKLTSIPCRPDSEKKYLEEKYNPSKFQKYEYCSHPQHKEYVEEVKRRWGELRIQYPPVVGHLLKKGDSFFG
jgi:hypothetical protein